MLVLDASVLVKLFRDEADSGTARRLIDDCVARNMPILAPSLLLYEILAVALHYEVPFDIAIELITALRRTGFRLVEPVADELRKAESMASRDSGAGFPGLKDSIYHAMAIARGGTFVTADRRHVEKAKPFGAVLLLSDWRPA